MATHFGQPTTIGILSGDFNNDGKIDVTNLGLLATNYGAGTTGGGGQPFSTTPIPEPTSLAFLTASVIPFLRRHRKA